MPVKRSRRTAGGLTMDEARTRQGEPLYMGGLLEAPRFGALPKMVLACL
jgi:hypothetical protein